MESAGSTERGISERFPVDLDWPYEVETWDYFDSQNGWTQTKSQNDITVKCKRSNGGKKRMIYRVRNKKMDSSPAILNFY